MARKNLLAGLTDAKLPAGNSETGTPPPAPQRLPTSGSRGAIGAVSRSIEQIKAQSILDIEPHLIDPSSISDRLAGSPEQHAELVASIREHGQQVPILVRPHPEKEGRYQIAYGRRRLRALTELGRKVRAEVKPLTDQQLVVAQGQENTARTDLSFIEKALFAAKLEEGGYDRETIMAALSVEKTNLSRLITSAKTIPHDLIEAIGPAPKAGRDRWLELATRLAGAGAPEKAQAVAGKAGFSAKPSDDRFNAVFAAVAPKIAPRDKPQVWKAEDGKASATIREDETSLVLSIDKKGSDAFARHLVEALPAIYAAFRRDVDEASKP